MTVPDDTADRHDAKRFDGLWNPNLGPDISEREDEYCELVLEQYQLYLETAESTSSRRLQTNAFFITLNTALLAGVSFVFSDTTSLSARLFAVGAVFLGLLLSLVWHRLIDSYRAINSAKFEVIGLLEQRLPASPVWNEEWSRLQTARKGLAKYTPITQVEAYIPKLMLLVYTFALAVGVFSMSSTSMTEIAPQQLELLPMSVDLKHPRSPIPDTPAETATDSKPQPGSQGSVPFEPTRRTRAGPGDPILSNSGDAQ